MSKPRPPSIIDYPTLQARKAYLGLHVTDLEQSTGSSSKTVCALMNGRESLNLETVKRISAALGLRVRVTFEVIGESETEEREPLRLIA